MEISTGQAKQSTFSIGDMGCSSCVDTVEKALKNINGVADARVNLKNESALVTYEANAVSTDDVKKAVEDAGYAFRGKQ